MKLYEEHDDGGHRAVVILSTFTRPHILEGNLFISHYDAGSTECTVLGSPQRRGYMYEDMQ